MLVDIARDEEILQEHMERKNKNSYIGGRNTLTKLRNKIKVLKIRQQEY